MTYFLVYSKLFEVSGFSLVYEEGVQLLSVSVICVKRTDSRIINRGKRRKKF